MPDTLTNNVRQYIDPLNVNITNVCDLFHEIWISNTESVIGYVIMQFHTYLFSNISEPPIHFIYTPFTCTAPIFWRVCTIDGVCII